MVLLFFWADASAYFFHSVLETEKWESDRKMVDQTRKKEWKKWIYQKKF